MKRCQFLKLSALSLPALACGIPRATPFQNWMQRFSAKLVSDAGGLSVEASIAPGQLAEAMHALSAVTDGPMRCEGSIVRGRSGGKELFLRFV